MRPITKTILAFLCFSTAMALNLNRSGYDYDLVVLNRTNNGDNGSETTGREYSDLRDFFSASQTSKVYQATFYNDGSETRGPVAGGTARLFFGFPCDKGDVYDFISPDKVVLSQGTCKDLQQFVTRPMGIEVNITIDPSTPFGDFSVERNGNPEAIWSYIYRLCNFEESTKYNCPYACYIKKDGTDPCGRPTIEECNDQFGDDDAGAAEKYICAKDGVKYRSYCHMHVVNKTEALYEQNTKKDPCETSKDDSPHYADEKNKIGWTGSFFTLESEELFLVCRGQVRRSSVVCKFFSNGIQIGQSLKTNSCEGEFKLLPAVNVTLPHVFIIDCRLKKNATVKSTRILISKKSPKFERKKLECNTNDMEKGQAEGPKCVYMDDDWNGPYHRIYFRVEKFNETSYTVQPEYWIFLPLLGIWLFVCLLGDLIQFVIEKYQSWQQGSSSAQDWSGTTEVALYHGKVEEKKGMWWGWWVVIGALGGAAILCAIGVVVLFVKWLRARPIPDNQKRVTETPAIQPATEIQPRLISSNPEFKTQATTPVNDNARLAHLTPMLTAPGQPYVTYLEELKEKFKEAEKAKNVLQILTCRWNGEVLGKVLKRNHVIIRDPLWPKLHELHMNSMMDNYNREILVCQAPKRPEMFGTLLAAKEKKVGLIVVIGPLVEGLNRMIDEYWAKETGQTMEIPEAPEGPDGKRKSTRVFSVFTEHVESPITGLKKYKLKMGLKDGEKKEVYLLHADEWPDDSLVPPEFLAGIAWEMENLLKGMEATLIHCSANVQRSPTVLCVHLCNQAIREYGTANVEKIMEYIRTYRANVWSNEHGNMKTIFGQVPNMIRAKMVLKEWHDKKHTLEKVRKIVIAVMAKKSVPEQVVVETHDKVINNPTYESIGDSARGSQMFVRGAAPKPETTPSSKPNSRDSSPIIPSILNMPSSPNIPSILNMPSTSTASPGHFKRAESQSPKSTESSKRAESLNRSQSPVKVGKSKKPPSMPPTKPKSQQKKK